MAEFLDLVLYSGLRTFSYKLSPPRFLTKDHNGFLFLFSLTIKKPPWLDHYPSCGLK